MKCLYSQWISLQGRNRGPGESTAFIIRSKQACSLSQRKTLPRFSRLLPANTILRNGPEKEQSRPSILGKLNKKCRVGEKLRGSQEESSQQQLLPSAPLYRWRSKWKVAELCSRTQLEELGSNTGRRAPDTKLTTAQWKSVSRSHKIKEKKIITELPTRGTTWSNNTNSANSVGNVEDGLEKTQHLKQWKWWKKISPKRHQIQQMCIMITNWQRNKTKWKTYSKVLQKKIFLKQRKNQNLWIKAAQPKQQKEWSGYLS